MPIILDYSREEQQVLRKTLPLVAFAVTVVSGGYINPEPEEMTASQQLVNAANKLTMSPFIQSLVRDIFLHRPTYHKQYDLKQPNGLKKIHKDVINRCQEAVAILSRKGTPEELNDYRRWIIAICENIAGVSIKKNGVIPTSDKLYKQTELDLLYDTTLKVKVINESIKALQGHPHSPAS